MQSAPRSAYVAPPVAALPKVEPAMTLSAPLPPVVVAQTKPPVPTPVPATVPPRRVNYSAASMFGFDASAMQAEGRAALDTLSKELVGAQYESIKVEGHTDRLGSTEYNQALSQRRADSVKDYLVNTAGVPPSKVSTAAMGEAKPVTKAEECKGTTQSAQLITCLQPDRRVEIEVSGTR